MMSDAPKEGETVEVEIDIADLLQAAFETGWHDALEAGAKVVTLGAERIVNTPDDLGLSGKERLALRRVLGGLASTFQEQAEDPPDNRGKPTVGNA